MWLLGKNPKISLKKLRPSRKPATECRDIFNKKQKLLQLPEIVTNKYFAKHTQPSLSPYHFPNYTHFKLIAWKMNRVSCILENDRVWALVWITGALGN